MPHINIKLWPGKDEEFKEKIANAARESVAEVSGVWGPDDISVSVEDIAKEEFDEKSRASFEPDELLIESKWLKK